MALRRILAVLLLFIPLAVYWAGEIPDAALLPTAEGFPLRLKPGRYQHLSWRMKTWDLVSGRVDQKLQPETEIRNIPYEATEKGWYTLSCEDRPRFLFQILPQSISIWWRAPSGLFTAFGELPLPLKPESTGTSYRMKGGRYVVQNVSCTAEEMETVEGRVEALRVVFSENGELCHTMWFTRTEGLVCWDGIEVSAICRIPGGGPRQQLLAAAMSYAGYGRVDDLSRSALLDCRAPPPVPASLSESPDESTHGRKFYYLFARDRTGYRNARSRDQRDGQLIVKESWLPGDPRKKGPLFLMLKSEGEWVYATAPADGMKLTSSGRLASCTRCHESEKTRDRLFGVRSDGNNAFLELRYPDSRPEDVLRFER